MSIGIMQSRLSPPEEGRFQCFPRERWREEFERAAVAGLDAIEWVWDARSVDINPLGTSKGVDEIKALSARHQVDVRSVCADYFMTYPLVRSAGTELAEREATLIWLLERCAQAEIAKIVLPFVDNAKLATDEDKRQAIGVLRNALSASEQSGVALHLETSLAPRPFAAMLDELRYPKIKVNYDSGNSASLGHRPADEFSAYGSRVGSVHVKDRILGGGTVPLGTGDADFPALATALREIEFQGDFILEAARGPDGDEVAWSRNNRRFLEKEILGTEQL